MFDLPRNQLLAYALVGAVVLVLGARQLRADAPAGPAAAPEVRVQRADRERVLVHVAGAVRRPGVYRLRAGARVDHAVTAAGGPTRRADLSGVNLAAEIEDGRQVIVPERAPPRATAAGVSAAPVPGQPLNLNTATAEQLDEIDGVGPATAKQILDFRERNGGFGSIEELGQVPGIGPKRLATLRELVTV